MPGNTECAVYIFLQRCLLTKGGADCKGFSQKYSTFGSRYIFRFIEVENICVSGLWVPLSQLIIVGYFQMICLLLNRFNFRLLLNSWLYWFIYDFLSTYWLEFLLTFFKMASVNSCLKLNIAQTLTKTSLKWIDLFQVTWEPSIIKNCCKL